MAYFLIHIKTPPFYSQVHLITFKREAQAKNRICISIYV